MLDVLKKISNLLKDLAPVELAGSEKELTLPSIYLQSISNNAAVTLDNKDFLTNFIYQIDIYAEHPQRCIQMAQAVDDIMQANGWRRSNGFLVARQRYTLTYKAVVGENYNIYDKE